MQTSIRFTLAILLIGASLYAFTSIYAQGKDKIENPLIGTWKFLKVVDANGNEFESYRGEVSYETFLENGTVIDFGVRGTFPYTGKGPETLEEYQKIGENVMGSISTYTVDPVNNKVTVIRKHAIRPTSVGKSLTVNFKVEADTVTYWFDSGEKFYKYVRVE